MTQPNEAAADADLDELRRRVVGTALPGGTFTVQDYERYLSHDAMQAPPLPDGLLHPAWILLGSLREKGMSTEDLVALAGATADDGVLGGELTFDQREPLRTGVDYRVTGAVTDLTRRHGKRAGAMDMLTFELTVSEPGGRICATSTQTFLILRRKPQEERR
ncbi:MAG TPA: hypothetical protein VGC04_02055 [Cellulomonas sp.]